MRGYPGAAPQAARFLILSAAIGSFSLAEVVAVAAGIAAAATAGLALGNLGLKYRETMEEFARDATLIALGVVFISLAGLIDFGAVLGFGISAILLVAAIMLVIRPLGTFIATVGVEQFTHPERLFLAAIGPRGIIPASVATLFAIELATAGNRGASQTLLGTVFVVIHVTDTTEAGFARQIADTPGVTPMRTILVGGGRVGLALAERLERRGEFVVVVDTDEERLADAREQGYSVHEGDGSEPDVPERAGIDEAKRVIAVTRDDDVTLLICQLVRTRVGIADVFARVNRPENLEAFESLSVTAIDHPLATALAVDDEIERPELAHWMCDTGVGHDIQEIEVTADALVGETVSAVTDQIPGGCIVAELGQGSDSHVPDGDEVLDDGEHVTFLGGRHGGGASTQSVPPT